MVLLREEAEDIGWGGGLFLVFLYSREGREGRWGGWDGSVSIFFTVFLHYEGGGGGQGGWEVGAGFVLTSVYPCYVYVCVVFCNFWALFYGFTCMYLCTC